MRMSKKYASNDIIRAVMSQAATSPLSDEEWQAILSSKEAAQRYVDSALDEARKAILDGLGIVEQDEGPARVSVQQVIEAACAAASRLYGPMTPDEVLSSSRRAPVVIARYIAILILRRHLGMTTVAIGAAIGRHHSSVIFAFERAEFLAANEKRYGETYRDALILIGDC